MASRSGMVYLRATVTSQVTFFLTPHCLRQFASIFVLVVGFAACGGKAHIQHKNSCELPQAVRNQVECDLNR